MTSQASPAVNAPIRTHVHRLVPYAAFAGALVAIAISVWPGAAASSARSSDVTAALAKRLPKTQVSAIDCRKLPGLCEVAAGSTLFYTDAKARYLIIGRVYDMETRTDLTATRLLELNPDLLVGGAARQPGADGQAGSPPAQPQPVGQVPLAQLPAKGAITWGPVQACTVQDS